MSFLARRTTAPVVFVGTDRRGTFQAGGKAAGPFAQVGLAGNSTKSLFWGLRTGNTASDTDGKFRIAWSLPTTGGKDLRDAPFETRSTLAANQLQVRLGANYSFTDLALSGTSFDCRRKCCFGGDTSNFFTGARLAVNDSGAAAGISGSPSILGSPFLSTGLIVIDGSL